MPEAPRTLLGFDVGTRRIGIAVGNTLTCTAQALEIAEASRVFEVVDRLIANWAPAGFVVGLPTQADGADTQGTAPARKFANRLAGRYRLPVDFVDERYTSAEAHAQYGKMAAIDHHAAALILQQYLDEPNDIRS